MKDTERRRQATKERQYIDQCKASGKFPRELQKTAAQNMDAMQKKMTIQETLKAIDTVTARLNQLKISPPVGKSKSKSKTRVPQAKQGDLGGNKQLSASNSIKSFGQYGTGGTGNVHQLSSLAGSLYQGNPGGSETGSNIAKQKPRQGSNISSMSITQQAKQLYGAYNQNKK
jgi:hypothetical protein